MKRVILHIGTEKTGSTSIQRAIVDNEETLRDLGVRTLESVRFREGSAKHKMAWGKPKDPGWRRLRHEVTREVEDGETVLLSNEALYRPNMASAIERLGEIFDGFEISVVMYVREQADYLQSMLMQNQKKFERAIDFDDPARFGEFLELRDMNYLDICSRIESVTGEGSMKARLFATEAFSGGSLLDDFFYEAIGIPKSTELTRARHSNPSLRPDVAAALRNGFPSVEDKHRYLDLLDIALRLSAMNLGRKHFLSEEQVLRLRERYVASNAAFASRYLQNADEIPLADVWDDGTTSDEDKQAIHDLLFSIADRSPKIGGRWKGGANRGREFFADGWNFDLYEAKKMAAIPRGDAPLVLRMRIPFQRLVGRSETLALGLSFRDSAPFPVSASVNGEPIGEVDLQQEPLRFPSSLAEPYDELEIILDAGAVDLRGASVVGLELVNSETT